jgi:hypothetical protein
MFGLWCSHIYGAVENGYQVCGRCGKARVVPCSHKWAKCGETKITDGSPVPIAFIIIQKCERCGVIQQVKVKA